jgi:regulator of sigma E protease
MGRPLSLRKRELAQRIGFSLLIALMILVFYNDILRMFRPAP